MICSHIDLLHLSRRLWRDRLPSRTLSNLEVHILRAQRSEEEVPGWMIPQMYFEYLRDGDARPLKRVFYHNAMDVVSMAALLNHTTSLLEDPTNFPAIEALEMAAAARLYEELGQTTRAIQLYRQCLNSPIAGELFLDTSERLALIYKRQEIVSRARSRYGKLRLKPGVCLLARNWPSIMSTKPVIPRKRASGHKLLLSRSTSHNIRPI